MEEHIQVKEIGTILNRDSAQPLHAQFEEIVRHKIDAQEWAVGAHIPSENELSRIYGISRMTVRAVLNRLVDAGLLYRVPGKGTFVSEPKIVSRPLSQMGIREQLEQMGYETSTELLGIEREIAPARIAKVLELSHNPLIHVIKRVRLVKGEPLSYHTSYIPARLCPDLESKDLVGTQLCDILEKEYHYDIVRMDETLESVVATEEESAVLQVKSASPLLLLENIVYTCGDIPMEYSKVLFRGDKIKIRLSFGQTG